MIYIRAYGTPDNNFRQQLRLNLDNYVLKIYRYNDATGKLEIADIVKGVNAEEKGKAVKISMLYDKKHFDPLFKKDLRFGISNGKEKINRAGSSNKIRGGADNIEEKVNNEIAISKDANRPIFNSIIQDFKKLWKMISLTFERILSVFLKNTAIENINHDERVKIFKSKNSDESESFRSAHSDEIKSFRSTHSDESKSFRSANSNENENAGSSYSNVNENVNSTNRADAIDLASEQAGFIRGNASGKGFNCLLYSIRAAIDNADGINSDNDVTEKWVGDLRRIAVECGFGRTEMLDVGNAIQPETKEYKLSKRLKEELHDKVLNIWIYNDVQKKMVHAATLAGIEAVTNGLSKVINVLQDDKEQHYVPLFPKHIQQNTSGLLQKENTSEKTEILQAKKMAENSDIETDKKGLQNLTELKKLTKELLNIQKTDVTPEIITEVNKYFKNGCNEEISDDNSFEMYQELVEMYNQLVDVLDNLNEKISVLESSQKSDKSALLKMLDEKEMLVNNTCVRMYYEAAICSGKIIPSNLLAEVYSSRKKLSKQNDLKNQIANLASMEVGEELTPQIESNLNNYVQNGSIDEEIQDWQTAAENLKTIKFYIMETAQAFFNEFLYYDLNREDLQKTLSKYQGFRGKIELVEKVRKKINSEIKICESRIPYEGDEFEKLKNAVEKIKPIKLISELSDEDFWDNFVNYGFRNVKIANSYYFQFGIMDEDLNAHWEERIKVLEDIQSDLNKIKGSFNIIEFVNDVRGRVEEEINSFKEYQEKVDLYNACAKIGLRRVFTPGNNNNCVLESITRTINRVNGNEKADPLKAYEEAAAWQEILRATADEIGIRHREGFDFSFYNGTVDINSSSDADNVIHSKFVNQLRMNLDNYILTEWKYDQKTKELIVVSEVKGKNSENNGVRINILSDQIHSEPMYSIDDFRGGRTGWAYSDPARIKAIKQASERTGFTRGMATGKGNNCFIQSLLQGIHYANGTKVRDAEADEKEFKAWENILRDEAVVNGFEQKGYLGVTRGKADNTSRKSSPYDIRKTDGTPDNNFRQQLQLNLDNYVLKIYRYNDAKDKLEIADIVNGVHAGENGKSVKLNMLYDKKHFDPLFEKNSNRKAEAENNRPIFDKIIQGFKKTWKMMSLIIEKALSIFMKDNAKDNANHKDRVNIFRTTHSDENKNTVSPKSNVNENVNSTYRAEEIAAASEQAGFICGNASGKGFNCLLYSIRASLDNADGMKSDNGITEKWVGDLRKIAVECGFGSTEMLDVGNTTQPETKEYKFGKRLKEELHDKVLNIWIYNDAQKKMVHAATFAGIDAETNGMSKAINILQDDKEQHYVPLFPIHTQQNTSESQKENTSEKTGNSQAKKMTKNVDVETGKNGIKNLAELKNLTNVLLKIEEIDVTPEMKEMVYNYFKHGYNSEKSTDNSQMYVMNYQMFIELNKMFDPLGTAKNKLFKEIDELTLLQNRVNSARLEELDEKEMMITYTRARMQYDISNLYGQIIAKNLSYHAYSGIDELIKQNNLNEQIVNLAVMEVGEELTAEIVSSLNDYVKNGSINENVKDWKTAEENFKTIKYYLMQTALNFSMGFQYFDLNRGDLQKTISKYKGLKEKLDLIEKVRVKINSEIQICHNRIPQESDAFEKLKTEVEKLHSAKTIYELTNSAYWKKFIHEGFRVESAAKDYYHHFGIMDEDLNGKWEERIKILKDIQLELAKIRGDNKKIKFIYNIGERVEEEINCFVEYKEKVDLYNACSRVGLRRGFTPGNNNNCVLESITKTINRANGNEKADPLKAYEDGAVWQEILRATADEIGIRHRDGFYLGSNNFLKKLINLDFSGDNGYFKFKKHLQLNLDTYTLNVWEYNPKTKQLEIMSEINGINSENNGAKINLLLSPGHAEPMFPIEYIGKDEIFMQTKATEIEKSKPHLKKWKTDEVDFEKMAANILWKVKSTFFSVFTKSSENKNKQKAELLEPHNYHEF